MLCYDLEHHRLDYTIDDSVNASHSRAAFPRPYQHRLDICRRARDDPQYFTRRRLLLQRFLEFFEQPRRFQSITASWRRF